MDLTQLVQPQLEDIDDRWRSGIRLFDTRVADFVRRRRGADKFSARFKTVRTAIYGDIHLDEEEIYLVDSYYLQRLRSISQMGLLHLVFPEARHSRFEHSLGVLWRTKQLLDMKHLEDHLRPYSSLLRLASLLHDIGHGPFSHSSERILQTLGADRRLRGSGRYHESRCYSMVTDRASDGTSQDFQLKRLNVPSYGLKAFLDEVPCPADDLGRIINGDQELALSSIINGPIDVDKLDYLRRDAFYTGAPPGGIDPERLMALMRWQDGRQGFDDKGIRTLLQFVYGRTFTPAMTVHHPVVRIAETMLTVAFDLALELAQDPGLQANILGRLELMDDNDLLRLLDTTLTAMRNVPSPGVKQRVAVLSDILSGLRSRKLWKVVQTLSSLEVRDMTGKSSLDELFDAVTEREILWSGATELAKQLGLPFDPPLVVAFALVPQPRNSSEIERYLKNITILGDDAPRSLFDCCLGKKHAQALAALQDDLWNLIIIGPEGVRWRIGRDRERRKVLKEFVAKTLSEPPRLRPNASRYVEALAKLEDWVIGEWGN